MNRPEELVMEEGEEVGAGRAEGSPATGGGGQAVMSLTADADRTQAHIFESAELEASH